MIALGHQRVRGRLRFKQCGSKLFGGGLHFMCSTLVGRQVDDELADPLDVRLPSLAYARMHRTILAEIPIWLGFQFGWRFGRSVECWLPKTAGWFEYVLNPKCPYESTDGPRR